MESDPSWDAPTLAEHLLALLAQCTREVEYFTDELTDVCIEDRFYRGHGPARPRTKPLTYEEQTTTGSIEGDWPKVELTRAMQRFCQSDMTAAQMWSAIGTDWRRADIERLRDERFILLARIDEARNEHAELVCSAKAAGASDIDVARAAGIAPAQVAAFQLHSAEIMRGPKPRRKDRLHDDGLVT